MAELIMQEEASTPSTPASGKWVAYFKSTGLFIKEDTGTETGPLGTGGGSSGLTVTAASVTTGNVTGVEGTLHNLDVSGMTANRDFNLPTPSAAGKRIGVRLSVGDATYVLLLKINAVEWSRIFITDEIVIFVSTGTGAGNWAVEVDGRIPQKARIKNTGAQSIANNTATVVTLDEVDFNIGDIANTANNRIDIRRGGKFNISGSYRFDNITANCNRLTSYLTNSAGTVIQIDERYAVSGSYPSTIVPTTKDLAAGEFVKLNSYQNSGASQNTLVTGGSEPHLELFEVF